MLQKAHSGMKMNTFSLVVCLAMLVAGLVDLISSEPEPYLNNNSGKKRNGGDMESTHKTGYLERTTRAETYTDADLSSKYVCYNGQISNTRLSNCIQVKATPLTSEEAHFKAAYIIAQVVRDMSEDMFRRVGEGSPVGVFTKSETATSYPEYHDAADTPACAGMCDGECAVTCGIIGRKYSNLAGIGGSIAVAMAENILCSSTDPYGGRCYTPTVSLVCRTSSEGRARLQQYDPTLYDILSEVYTNNMPHVPTVLSPCV